jgi:hypothetical protein
MDKKGIEGIMKSCNTPIEKKKKNFSYVKNNFLMD